MCMYFKGRALLTSLEDGDGVCTCPAQRKLSAVLYNAMWLEHAARLRAFDDAHDEKMDEQARTGERPLQWPSQAALSATAVTSR